MNDDQRFQVGYVDGWQSIRPGTVPDIPAYALPAGRDAYEYGHQLGKDRASGSPGQTSI